MSDDYTDPYPTFDDGYERFQRDEWYERRDDLRLRALDRVEVIPDPRPQRRLSRSQAARIIAPSWTWKRDILERDQGCCVHRNPADCSEGWQAHHVVSQQDLRRRSRPDAIWHPSSGMGVCGLAHRQHHSRVRPILHSEIPLVCVEYLTGLGFGPYLERRYP